MPLISISLCTFALSLPPLLQRLLNRCAQLFRSVCRAIADEVVNDAPVAPDDNALRDVAAAHQRQRQVPVGESEFVVNGELVCEFFNILRRVAVGSNVQPDDLEPLWPILLLQAAEFRR